MNKFNEILEEVRAPYEVNSIVRIHQYGDHPQAGNLAKIMRVTREDPIYGQHKYKVTYVHPTHGHDTDEFKHNELERLGAE